MYRSRVQATPHECALAAEMFNHFCSAGTMKQILALHREICNILDIKPARLPDFYPQLKAKLVSSWQAQAVFKKLDTRANHKVYAKGKACPNTRVLIIGAGPCGLRAAIECQLLGAKVVVMEKRDRMSRNNVLHLWPFVINDLRGLGAKKFFGKFCAGSIDHISIRQLQCILLKVCLLLGVEFHEGVSFEELLEPTAADKENNDVVGWRARVDPAEHPVSDYEFDVLLGADGKRNTLRGFKRKEFRGKLAIAITANFINRHSEQEAAVPEISGVAFIFNQKFFKDLFKETGIDLENIVYYKDDTHYFVMTAKKSSLINKGVILRDYAETSRLLSADNVDRNALLQYAHEAAQFSTKGLLPRMDFALNHYGEPDIALFDFTSMYAAENASMVLERSGHRLLCGLVGDSLLEPFWPTGSGCARGFLSAMDAAWSVRQWGQAPAPHPLVIIAERESIYRLLGQTTPENLQRNLGAYTLEPSSRYPNLNTENVTPHRVTSFYNSDEPLPLDVAAAPRKRARGHLTSEEVPSVSVRRSRKRRSTRPSPQEEQLLAQAEATLRRERERIRSQQDVPNLTKEINEPNLAQDKPTRPLADEEWVPEGRSSRKRRSPFSSKKEEAHMVGGGGGTRSGGSQAISRLVAELASGGKPNAPRANKPQDLLRAVGRIESGDWNVKQIERKIHENKMGRPQPKAAEKVPKWDKEQFLERQNRLGGSGEGAGEERWGELDETLKQLDQKLRDSGRPTLGTQKVAKLADRFVKKAEPEPERPVEPPPGKTWTAAAAATVATSAARCAACGARVFAAESVVADGLQLHRSCFRCAVCRTALRPGSYTMEKNGTRLVCLRHGTSVPDGTLIVERRPAKGNSRLAAETPERIVLDVSDDGAREMDEDEWTDRNFLASETSCAGGLSDEEDSSDEEEYEEAGGESGVSAGEAAEAAEYDGGAGGDGAGDRDDELSDDSFGYDDFSDDSADSSGAESSRLREAREARRREVPPANDAATPYRGTDSSEVESEEESSITESEASSATRVSTDSEFDITYKIPPAITVTEAPIRPAPPPSPPVYRPPPPQPPSEYPLSRTRSAGGIATKRALELKRRYLLGEAVSPSVRRSDSTSNLDNKIESFQSNISQFQKLLNPATPEQTRKPNPIFSLVTNMSEVISNFDRSLAEFTEEPDSLNTIQIDTAVDLSSSLLNTVDYNSVHTSVIEKDLSNRMNGTVIDLDTTKDLIQDTVINLDTTEESVVSNDHIISANSTEWQRDSAIELDTTEEKILCSSAQGVVDSDLIEDPESDNSSAQENTLNELDSESLSDSSSTARGSLPKQAVNISKTGSNQQIPRLEVHNDSGEVILSDSPDVSEWAEEGLDDYPNISRGTKALSGPKNLDNIDSAHVCGKESSFMNEIEYLEFVDDDSEATKSIELPTTLNIPTQCNDKPNSPTKEITTPINNTVSTRISDRPGDISFSTLMSFVVRTPAPVLPEVITPVTNVETFLVSSPITPIADTLTISSPVTPNTGSSPISSPVTPILVDKTSKKEEIKRERENQTELVKRMVLERIGSTNASGRKRRPRVLPSGSFPPPIPPAPVMPAPPARPPPPATLTPSASDPELARVRRQRGIVHTVTEFFNKRLSPRNKWASDTELIMEQRQCASTMSVLAREPPAATVARSCDCVSAGGAPTRKHAKGRAWVTRRL